MLMPDIIMTNWLKCIVVWWHMTVWPVKVHVLLLNWSLHIVWADAIDMFASCSCVGLPSWWLRGRRILELGWSIILLLHPGAPASAWHFIWDFTRDEHAWISRYLELIPGTVYLAPIFIIQFEFILESQSAGAQWLFLRLLEVRGWARHQLIILMIWCLVQKVVEIL